MGSGGWKMLEKFFFTEANKSKYSSNLNDIFKSKKETLWHSSHKGDNFQIFYYLIS